MSKEMYIREKRRTQEAYERERDMCIYVYSWDQRSPEIRQTSNSCVAVWCNVLQCVAVCCSVVQRVAVCCSELQCVAVRCQHHLAQETLVWVGSELQCVV